MSLISGSLQDLEEYVAALSRYVQATDKYLGQNHEMAQLRTELQLDYILDHAPALQKICTGGARRLHHVVDQLRGYTRGPAEVRPSETAEVRSIVDEAIGLAAHGRENRPSVCRDFPDHLPQVAGSADSLSQVFVNLIGNAFDAVASVADPQVWISGRLQGATVDAARLASVEVRVRDNGSGIPPAQRPHIFEPFFTTKSSGSGLGLGLAIAREIVEGHGGTIELTESGGGTTEFVLRLPVAGPV